jgi:hypothetical protein
MDLKSLIGKELFVKPDFTGSFYIHSEPEFNGDSIEMTAEDFIGVVKTIVESKEIPGLNFLVVDRANELYYCNADFLKYTFFSSLQGEDPEIVANKTYIFLSIAAAIVLFIILKNKK